MTLPANIRLAMQVPFPAMVTGQGPISVTKANGVWTFGFSTAALGVQNPPPNNLMNTDYVLTYDSVNQTYANVPIGSFFYTAGRMRFVAKNVNFNSANTDTAIPIVLPSGITRYMLEGLRLSNASGSLTLSTCGLFASPGGTGTILVANSAVTVATAATDSGNNSQVFAGSTTVAYSDATLYFRIGTAQGSAATADAIVYIVPLS
jgi:hypothetical protein